jgi:hypothetical protein
MAMRSYRVAVVVAVAAVLLAACGAPSDGVSVEADPTDLIQGARFIEWEQLPPQAQEVRPPLVDGEREYVGVAVVLPGSEARRLLIAVWHNACMPAVSVAATDLDDVPRLAVSIADAETDCGEILNMWPFEVTLNRDVDPATVVLDVTDSRPRPLASVLRDVEWTLRARTLERARRTTVIA